MVGALPATLPVLVLGFLTPFALDVDDSQTAQLEELKQQLTRYITRTMRLALTPGMG